MSDDPFAVLGLTRDATLEQVRDARRRLARELHPDLHATDPAQMQRVNVAFDACVGHLTRRRPLPEPTPAPVVVVHAPRRRSGIEIDAPSFTIDALPAEAFEALLIVAATLGDVIDDDPPYVLEGLLRGPRHSWCRLELVPDAGASTVSLMVAGVDGCAHPPAEDVRDVWVEELNRLGRPTP